MKEKVFYYIYYKFVRFCILEEYKQNGDRKHKILKDNAVVFTNLCIVCFNKRIVLQRCSAGMPAEKERICQMSGKPGCCLREPKQSFNRGTQIS